MNRNWEDDLNSYEQFLKNINVQKYSPLRKIKTVEQDLPSELIPLEIYYKYYWENIDFKDFDEIFKIYWNEKLSPYIYEFSKKYFYGCSMAFVEEGFKARLYRTWMSLLTQFYFQYLWNALLGEKLESNAKLDKMGIDAIVEILGKRIALQVKKVSYRREASDRIFKSRQRNQADIIVKIPYLVIDIEEMKRKIKSTRTWKSTKKTCKNLLKIFNNNFIKYDNGFVVFRKEYLKDIYKKIGNKIPDIQTDVIAYDEILKL